MAPPSGSGLLSAAAAEVLQPNGSIVAGGQTAVVGAGGGSSNAQFEVARFTGAGHLDASFGNNGQVITSFGGSNEFVTAVMLQTDGKIVAVGNSALVSGTSSTPRFALARYLGQ